MHDITAILNDLAEGRTSSQEELWRMLYQELRSMAVGMLANERPGHTLQPTALIHEAYLRLLGGDSNLFANRRYFFGAAAQAMRRILVDTARRKQSIKAGGEREQVPWEEPEWTAKLPPSEVVAIHEALERLQQEDVTAAEIVNMHFFAGFSLEEAADLLGIARATAYRSWTYARAWLRDALDDEKD